MDGAFALRKIAELHPDVVTLDLEMPRMDGIETLRLIMRRAPLPVIVFSTHSKEGAYSTFKALALGAIDFVAKPKDAAAGHLDPVADQLIEKIKVAKRAGGRKLPAAVASDDPPAPSKKKQQPPALIRPIASSPSESPPAVPTPCNMCSRKFPPIFRPAFVVVQHMPEGFTEMFAKRLDECCALEVQEATPATCSSPAAFSSAPAIATSWCAACRAVRWPFFPTALPSTAIVPRLMFCFTPSPRNLASQPSAS